MVNLKEKGPACRQAGFAHVLLLLLLLAGLLTGVYLVTSSNPLKLFSKAANPPIVFKSLDEKPLPTNTNGIPQTSSPSFKIELTSTLGPPATGSSSVRESPTLLKAGMNLSFLEQRKKILRLLGSGDSLTPQTFSVLKIFGQTKDTETSRNLPSKKGIYHASGVLVDRSSTPNKVYVVDTGNNRILGYNGVGYCSNTATRACTTDSDCGSGASCKVDGSKDADLVFGQDNFGDAACNRDNNQGFNKLPAASTLCLAPYPIGTNTAEYWMRTNIDIDNEGSLYVTDIWNNRVLKYNQPFSSDKTGGKGDGVADFAVGQKDLNTNGVNRGINYKPFTSPSQNSLWLSKSPEYDHVSSRGVSVDPQKNIWVADTFNGRVLRFPAGANTADLVIGQADFNSVSKDACRDNGPLNKLCTPTLAKINPRTGDLYVLDEHPAPFKARILIFKAPFTNGMIAYKSIIPTQGPGFAGSSYFFQATGFTFNTYTQGDYAAGTLWVNEHQSYRTILIDDNGNVIKVIGAPNNTTLGGDQNYTGDCGSIYEGFNLWAPGGSLGLDSSNNIYLADERFHRISRYSLPYQARNINGKICLPPPNGGLFAGTEANIYSDEKLGESLGLALFGNQLIVLDEDRKLKVWNDYLNKPNGAPPDFVISGTMPTRVLFGEAIDDADRLWMLGEHGELKVYQLPFRSSNDQPLADFIPLLWSDNNSPVNTNIYESGLTFDSRAKALYLADRGNNRVFRIKDYNNYASGLHVDMVIGQPDKTSTECNFNQGRPWLAEGAPTAASLCNPAEVRFDKLGNLYVVESGYECHGNNRISVFMADDLRNATGLFPLISARKVFNQPNLTTQPQPATCSPNVVDKPGTPISIAFNSANQMYIGNDGYYGDDPKRQLRQLWFYADPLNKQTPDGYIELPMGAPGEIAVDSNNNLIIQDHTWYRTWVINTSVVTSSPSPSPTPPTGTVSYKIAEDPTDLDQASDVSYKAEPTDITYTLKDQTPGIKFIWVEFKDITGKTDRRTAQIELVSANPTPSPIVTPTATSTPKPTVKPAITPVPTTIPTSSLGAPEMVYPQNGQTIDLEGAYMFKVKPVAGAGGYLFGFFQNGVMIFENQRDTGTLSPNGEFAIWESDPAHVKFRAGEVKVMIRALVNNNWTDAREIIIILKPR